jgi:hypothetical protein
MVPSRMFHVFLAATLAFAAGCSGSDDEGIEQADQGVTTEPNQAVVADDGSNADGDQKDPCAAPNNLHNPQCQGADGTRPPKPAPAPN